MDNSKTYNNTDLLNIIKTKCLKAGCELYDGLLGTGLVVIVYHLYKYSR